MHDGIHFSDMRQELVAQAFALGCTAHQTGNVNKFYNSRNGLGRLIHFAQLIQTFIRHAYHADIRVDGAERIIRRLRAGIRDGIEQGALSHVRQSDNTNFHVLRSFNLSCGMIWSPRLFLHTFYSIHLFTSSDKHPCVVSVTEFPPDFPPNFGICLCVLFVKSIL